ncbi:MAG: TetR/AcrR family transcriptional regulator [Ruminococcaceae bacterium]|nr:TetR/AcrR family transcriptional regulator [Oscillospiraceae bacterium]
MEKDTKTENELITDAMSATIVETAERIATVEGTQAVSVRRILTELGITNRVFYNRFRNADEVLELVYKSMVVRIRTRIVSEYDGTQDFFSYVMDVVERSLTTSYDTKLRCNQFLFENDSLSNGNYEWWTGEIKKLIDYARERDLIRDVDSEALAYSIWCFCRGYNADAVGRGLPREEAIEKFRYGFGFLLDGLKK